jgi:toxin YoeB
MNLLWTAGGWNDYLFWQENDRSLLRRINILIRDVQRAPFSGIGKPEPLSGDFAGWWARRITSEHRLVYRIVGSTSDQRLEIAGCRFHYSRRR